jgi:predicted Abi (CAAX) family protease
MFISMSNFQKWSNQTEIRSYIASNPNDENVKRLLAFKELSRDYLEGIIKWAGARDDWGDAKAGLVVNRKEEKGIVAAIKGAATMALSYKFVAPRFANDNMLKMFYERNALIWIVKTSQIGGEKQGIFPAAAGCETNCLAEFQKMFKFGGN